jgi:CubicO group peptidase (beta-lactamase class C family)
MAGRSLGVVLLLACTLVIQRNAQPQTHPSDPSFSEAVPSISSFLQEQVSEGDLRGSVLVAVHGKILFEKGYSFADEEWGIQNTPTTRFRIASLTKQFTAACVLLLQERHLLSVNDPVSKYIQDLPAAWQPITLHELLTHTSGIPNYAEMQEVEKTLNRTGASPRQLVDLAASRPLEFKPGTQLKYTNTGYVLLGLVIEKVSGLAYGDFLTRNIFHPLGMKDSGYDDPSIILPRRASGYMRHDGKITNADYIDMSIPYAAGSIYSTVEDMLRWSEALAHGQLLSKSSSDAMFALYPEASLQGQHYGYGVVLARRFGKDLQYHGGGVKGFESVIQRYPKEDVCIVVLENLDPTAPWDLGDKIASLLFRVPVASSH